MIQRFRCRGCGKTCSTQTFSVHYWTHSTQDLAWMIRHMCGCSGLRQIGRYAGVDYCVVANRVRRLARNALSVMDAVLSSLSLREDLAMDGFQSFTRSQYHPNNITHVVGSDSQFAYAAVHTALRRSGSMTDRQKLMRALIDQLWSPRTNTTEDVTALLSDLAPAIGRACADRKVTISSDKHRAYRPAILAIKPLAAGLAGGRLIHQQISSRAARTRSNPLFAVNYFDRQIRMNIAEHVRETTRQGREVNCQMERMAVFMVVHNFLTPHRIRGHRLFGLLTTHAIMAGVSGDRIERLLDRMVTHRHVWSHCQTGHEWMKRIWKHLYANPPAVRVRKQRPEVRLVARGPQALPAHLLA